MEMLWHPTKKEIEDWLESKMLAFAQEQSAENGLDLLQLQKFPKFLKKFGPSFTLDELTLFLVSSFYF